MRRTPEEYKAYYSRQWARAAEDTLKTISMIKGWFPSIDFNTGHGAITSGWSDKEHNPGSPDIFLMYNDSVVCAIEVTGSACESVTIDSTIYIGAHKMKHALEQCYPTAFALYYPTFRRFVTANEVQMFAPEPREINIGEAVEYYHVLQPNQVHGLRSLCYWIMGCMDHAQFDRLDTLLRGAYLL